MRIALYNEFYDNLEYKTIGDRKKPSSNRDILNRAADILPELMKNELSTNQRNIIQDYYFKGLKITQIARIHGINKSTVSRTKKRAEERIIRCLKYYSFK